MKKLFIFVMLCMFGALLPCFGDSTDAISFQEKEICRYFDKFKFECSKDSFDKLNRAIGNIREIQSPKVRNIRNYVSAVKEIKKIKTTFVYFKFGEGFTNKYEDNGIRIYVNGDQVANVGDISEHEGVIVDNGKYNWKDKTSPIWDLNFNDNYYLTLCFENWIICGFNKTSKRFQISKYEIFAKSCETGEYYMNLDDEKQNARISLKFTDLPVIEK